MKNNLLKIFQLYRGGFPQGPPGPGSYPNYHNITRPPAPYYDGRYEEDAFYFAVCIDVFTF